MICGLIYWKEEKQYQKQQQKIETKVDIEQPISFESIHKQLETSNKSLVKASITYNFPGIGLLKFSTGLKLNIENNTNQETLDSLSLGVLKNSDSIDSNSGVLILAGHNMRRVFAYLHQIKINELVFVYTKKTKQTYQVISKMTIDETDFSNFKESSTKMLYMFTCTKTKNKRLLVTAKLIKNEDLT